MNIGFACEWKKKREQTWSHTPISLLQGLLHYPEHHIQDIDLQLPTLVRYPLIAAAMRYSLRQRRLKSGYIFSPLHDALMQYTLRKKVQKMPNLDAVISMGDYGSIHPVPQYVYFDVTMAEYAEINTHNRYGQTEALQVSKRNLKRRVQRQNKLFQECEGVFSMSRHAADEFVRISGAPHSKVHVVHAGINIPNAETILPPPLNEPYILFVGREFNRKGGDIVLNAFKLIRHTQKVKLVIAGPKQWEWGEIPDGVIYLGETSRTDLQAYFQHARAYVMPSRYEAFGIVFAEALCFGVPVIARNAFAMKEMIQHGVNGYLMQGDSDSPEELAELISTTLENTAMKRYVEEHREEYRAYYSWNRVAADMLAIIGKDIGK